MAQNNFRTATKRRLVHVRLESLELRTLLSSVGWDGPGAGTAELTYTIGDAPSYLDQAIVDEAIEQALSEWAKVVDVEFTETSRPNQNDSIDFAFAPLDGPGGTLAQAYLPDDVNTARIAGDVQFDTAETWEIGDTAAAAFDLVLVAVHEIGHALGLEHSPDSDAVMAAYASPTQSYSGLSPHDVDAAIALYAPAGPDASVPDVDSSVQPPVAPPNTPTTDFNPLIPPDTPPTAPWDPPAQDPSESPTSDPPETPTTNPGETPSDNPWDPQSRDPWGTPRDPWETPARNPWESPWTNPWSTPWNESPFAWFRPFGHVGLGWIGYWFRIR